MFYLFPFDFLMEQLHCSKSVVAMFYNVLFYVFPQSGFLYLYGFIYLSRFRIWLRCVLSFNSYKVQFSSLKMFVNVYCLMMAL
jgi:hypothetical protein